MDADAAHRMATLQQRQKDRSRRRNAADAGLDEGEMARARALDADIDERDARRPGIQNRSVSA